MKQNGQLIWCWGALLVLAILFISWIASSANPSLPDLDKREIAAFSNQPATFIQSIHATVAPSVNTPERTAALFVAGMGKWEITPMPDADRIEEELKAMLSDSNAGAIARALPQKFLKTYLGLMVQARWAAVDREAAVQWMAHQSKPTRYQVDAVVRNWITQNKTGVYNYLDRLPKGEWKNNLLVSISDDAIVNNDPVTACFLLRDLDPGEEQTRLMGKAILQWSRFDPKAAIEQINQLPDEDLQEKLVPSVAYGYATIDPGPAADWALQSLDPGETLNQTLRGVLGTWVEQRAPMEAAAWVAKLPEGGTRQSALEAVITSWAKESPQEAAKWVDNLSGGSLRNQAIDILTKATSPEVMAR